MNVYLFQIWMQTVVSPQIAGITICQYILSVTHLSLFTVSRELSLRPGQPRGRGLRGGTRPAVQIWALLSSSCFKRFPYY